MIEANDSIYYIPDEGLFCLIECEAAHGFFGVQGLEALILSERALCHDTDLLEQKLMTLRHYNRGLTGWNEAPGFLSQEPVRVGSERADQAGVV